VIEPATRLRAGMIINHNGEHCRVVEVDHVTPGKGPGHVQAKMKNIETGANVNHRFRSDEKFEKVFLEKKQMQYLFSADGMHTFMDTDTYEQISLNDELMGDAVNYLIQDIEIEVQFMENKPVGVELPTTVELTVIETAPHLKGSTVTSSYKPAKVDTGIEVQVPPYIENGQKIKVDTRDNSFLSKIDD
jgi:elongation factor P